MGLRPWYGLWPINVGHSPNQGHSPELFLLTPPARRSLASHPAAEPLGTVPRFPTLASHPPA